MIIKVKTVVGNYQVKNQIGHIFRVANFEIQGDRIKASLGGAAGNMLVFNGTAWVVVPAPLANNMHLVSDVGLAYKVKWETQPSAGGVTSGPQAFGDNYIITPSIAGNNLTVALKTIAGTDPTASDKIPIRIGNTRIEITAAISTTKNAGTNWLNAGSTTLAGHDIDYFVYLIQETGGAPGTKIGFARIPYARTMADFVNTATNELYIAGNWSNFNATDEVENIGRFRAQLSAAAGHNWSIPTGVVINRPIDETGELAFTPIWANLTVGNGSTAAVYRVIGKRFIFNHRFTLGGTTVVGTNPNHTIPFSAGATYPVPPNAAFLEDAGTAFYPAWITINANNVTMYSVLASGTYASLAGVAATVPFTWVAGDKIHTAAVVGIAH